MLVCRKLSVELFPEYTICNIQRGFGPKLVLSSSFSLRDLNAGSVLRGEVEFLKAKEENC